MSYSENVLATEPRAVERPMNWPAVFAGAIVAVAITIILTMIAAGLGLSAVSPWAGEGASAKGVLLGAAIALVVIQWIAAIAGGYIAGRMRAGWAGLEAGETFFRDTVHGLVAWTVAALIIMTITTSSLFSVAGAGVRATAAVTGTAASTAGNMAGGIAGDGLDYVVDGMFRSGQPGAAASQPVRPEVAKQISRIFARSVSNGTISDDDRRYVTGVAANAAGISQADAEARLNAALKTIEDLKMQAKKAADEARKASAATALLTALALCIGAFFACVAAVFGGRARDDTSYPV